MKPFARNTPSQLARLLREQLAVSPNHPVIEALATDDQMADLWAELGKLGEWRPGALILVELAVHFSGEPILSIIRQPPEGRWPLSWPEYALGYAARTLANLLGWWHITGAELLGEPVDALVVRLRAFEAAAFERAKAKHSAYDYIPAPSRRGRGNPKQLAFRTAFATALQILSEDASLPGHPLAKERQDLVVATITNVIFPKHHVDTETIRRHRQRHRRGRRAGDNSLSE